MSDLKPAADVREEFGGNFYRMQSPEEEDYLISPAAVLKILLTAALGANSSLTDEIFWDLYIKHIDFQRLQEEAAEEGIWDLGFVCHITERLAAELSAYIKTEDLLEFFKKDFSELGDKVLIENFIAVDGKFELQADYQQLAKEFFNVILLRKNLINEKKLLGQRFSNLTTEAGLDIFGAVSFNFTLPKPFVLKDDGSFEAVGTFNYNKIKNRNSTVFLCDVVEIVLDAEIPLTMLVFLPNDFRTLLLQSIGRDYTNFNAIAEKLKPTSMKIVLPKLDMETKVDLTKYMSETNYRGLRDFFTEPIEFNRLFENIEGMETNVGKYWQYTSLKMRAENEDGGENLTEVESEVTIDTTKESFLYVIKSDKVLYVMGHQYKKN